MSRHIKIMLFFFFYPLCALVETPITFSDWQQAILEVPEYNRQILPQEFFDIPAIVSFNELKRAFDGMLEEMSLHYYEQELWVNGVAPDPDAEQEPFMQKVVVNPGMTLYIQGDIHGSIHSLIRNLDKLKEKGFLHDDFSLHDITLFFLGDYGDRGRYSVEVLYTLARLKEMNPDKVFMIRGNHESLEMGEFGGLFREVNFKYGEKEGNEFLRNDLNEFFSLLPLMIFAGTGTVELTNYLLLCHGLPTFGYDPREFLAFKNHEPGESFAELNFDKKIWGEQLRALNDDTLMEKGEEVYERKKRDLDIIPFHHELNWADISPEFGFNEHRLSLVFPIDLVRRILGFYNSAETNNFVYAIFRGHQHADTGGSGCFEYVDGLFEHCKRIGVSQQLQQDSVYTLVSAPEGIGLGRDEGEYDSFVLINTAPNFDEWRMIPYEYSVGGSLSVPSDQEEYEQKEVWRASDQGGGGSWLFGGRKRQREEEFNLEDLYADETFDDVKKPKMSK